MMTIAAYLIAAYPTREFDSGSWIGSWWSVNWSAPPFSFSHDVDWEQLIGSDVIELKSLGVQGSVSRSSAPDSRRRRMSTASSGSRRSWSARRLVTPRISTTRRSFRRVTVRRYP
jgi:hypothetical protein